MKNFDFSRERMAATAIVLVLAVLFVIVRRPGVERVPTDPNAPLEISAGEPAGALDEGTSAAELQVKTNLDSRCKYNFGRDMPFDEMPFFFENTGKKKHSHVVDGLREGREYTYQVRCRAWDERENREAYRIKFNVEGTAISQLWGNSGELWDARGRLYDYSFAGYQSGDSELPFVAQASKVTDFGAVPDDDIDDTAAFITAVRDTPRGAILIPEGRYIITKKIIVRKSGIVFRGEGAGKTTLYFPNSLSDVYGFITTGGQSDWAYSGGFIAFEGTDWANKTTKISDVAAQARRGDKEIVVADAAGITPGSVIRITQTDPATGPNAGSLLRHMHADMQSGGSNNTGEQVMRFVTEVTAVRGNVLALERPLPLDIRYIWSPEVHRFEPSLRDVGIENLKIEFAKSVYPGHFKERGYNAVEMRFAADCWIKNVGIINADTAVFMNGTNFCTLQTLHVDADAGRGELVGHHAIAIDHGNDNVVRGFVIAKKYVHDLAVSWYSMGTVLTEGSGQDLSLDLHRSAPYATLFSNIYVGRANRVFESGGSRDRGPNSAAFTTYWNIRGDKDFALPAENYGPKLNFVGLNLRSMLAPEKNDWLVEKISPEALRPVNIFDAMRLRRLGSI